MPEGTYTPRSAPVEAIQFQGGEASARHVIEWAGARKVSVRRYLHSGSWNDAHPDLWLRIVDAQGLSIMSPRWWLIVDGRNVAVLPANEFDDAYEPAGAI